MEKSHPSGLRVVPAGMRAADQVAVVQAWLDRPFTTRDGTRIKFCRLETSGEPVRVVYWHGPRDEQYATCELETAVSLLLERRDPPPHVAHPKHWRDLFA